MREQVEKNSLNELLSKELVGKSIDLTTNFTEVAIDAFIEDGVVKDIPIVGSIISLSKLGVTVRNAHLSRKILCFLKEFHSGGTLDNKMVRFKERIQNDEVYRTKVTEHLVIIIDRLLTESKSIMLARLLNEYINEEFDWETFVYFSVCLDSMHDIDFKVLRYLLWESNKVIGQISIPCADKYMLLASTERLKAYGFIGYDGLTWESTADDFKKSIFLSSLGIIFTKVC